MKTFSWSLKRGHNTGDPFGWDPCVVSPLMFWSLLGLLPLSLGLGGGRQGFKTSVWGGSLTSQGWCGSGGCTAGGKSYHATTRGWPADTTKESKIWSIKRTQGGRAHVNSIHADRNGSLEFFLILGLVSLWSLGLKYLPTKKKKEKMNRFSVFWPYQSVVSGAAKAHPKAGLCDWSGCWVMSPYAPARCSCQYRQGFSVGGPTCPLTKKEKLVVLL